MSSSYNNDNSNHSNYSFDSPSFLSNTGYNYVPVKTKKPSYIRKSATIMNNGTKSHASRTHFTTSIGSSSDWSATAPNLTFNQQVHSSSGSMSLYGSSSKNPIGCYYDENGAIGGAGELFNESNLQTFKDIGALWNSFITDEMIDKIVVSTNNTARKTDSDWSDTDADELKRFFGIWYFIGINGMHHLSVDALYPSSEFDADESTVTTERDDNNKYRNCGLPDTVRAVLSMQRFSDLLHFLSFNSENEENGGRIDSVSSMLSFFDDFINRCKFAYEIGANVYIDESVAGFSDMSEPFVKISHNLGKCGIRIWCMNDCRNFYLCNALIDLDNEHFYPLKVVNELTENCRNSGRTVVCDTNFTSVELADNLYADQTFLVGKISPATCGGADLPADFLQESAYLPENKCQFLFNSYHTLLTWRQPRTERSDYYLSTLHHSADFVTDGDLHLDSEDSRSERPRKPLIADYYDTNSLRYDSFDRVLDVYSSAPASSRPVVRLFAWILDAAAWNASRLHVNPEITVIHPCDYRRSLLSTLAWELMENRIPKNCHLFFYPLRKNDPADHYNTFNLEPEEDLLPQFPPSHTAVDQSEFYDPSSHDPNRRQPMEEEADIDKYNASSSSMNNHFQQYLSTQFSSIKQHLIGAKKRKFRGGESADSDATNLGTKPVKKTRAKDLTKSKKPKTPKSSKSAADFTSNLPTMVKADSVQDSICSDLVVSSPTPPKKQRKRNSAIKLEVVTVDPTGETISRPEVGQRHRCLLCPRQVDRKTRYHCVNCGTSCCTSHMIYHDGRWLGHCCYKPLEQLEQQLQQEQQQQAEATDEVNTPVK